MPEHYEITIVRYGTRSTHKSDVYLNFPIYGAHDEPVDMDYFFWVLKSQNRTILVDTGFSRAGGQSRNRRFLLDPEAAYRALGIDVTADQTIIVTHAHYDHIGNLSLFPRAHIVISRSELEFWTGPFSARAQYQWSVERDEIEGLRQAAAQGRVETFSGSLTLAPGVDVIEVGGHTPGQSVVRVQTSDGPVLLASDSAHYLEELELDRPFAFVSDLMAMYAGFDKIRGFLADGSVAHVIPGHDPNTLDRFTAVDVGVLAGHAATLGQLTFEEEE